MSTVNEKDDNRWYFGKADWILKAIKDWLHQPVCAFCSDSIFLTLNLLFMKKLLWAVVPMIALMLSCEKQMFNSNSPNGEKKFGAVETGVKVPFKGTLIGYPTAAFNDCVPGQPIVKSMMIGGSGSHMGEIQVMNSWWMATTCVFDPDKMLLTEEGDGVMTADNGDSYNIHAVVTNNLAYMTFTGKVTIDGGNGKFEGCVGEVDMINGRFLPNQTLVWDGVGYIIFAK